MYNRVHRHWYRQMRTLFLVNVGKMAEFYFILLFFLFSFVVTITTNWYKKWLLAIRNMAFLKTKENHKPTQSKTWNEPNIWKSHFSWRSCYFVQWSVKRKIESLFETSERGWERESRVGLFFYLSLYILMVIRLCANISCICTAGDNGNAMYTEPCTIFGC